MSARTVPMARELAALGHKPVIIVPPWDTPDRALPLEISHEIPVRNVRVPVGLLQHPGSMFRLLRAVLAERPDVVVCVKPKAYAALFALLFGQLNQRRGGPMRLVVDTDDWEGSGGWNDMGATPRFLRGFVALNEQLALRAADQVIVASRELENLVSGSGVPESRLSYIPNGSWEGAAGWLKGDRQSGRARLGMQNEPLILLYSRLFEFDRERVVENIRRILDAVPNARLLVVGIGLSGEEDLFRRSLSEYGILNRSHLVGWVERPQLPDILAAADVAIVPMDDSRVNRSRCSVKLLDLMLSSVPIVADRVGQVPSFLTNGVSGVTVDPSDPVAMSREAIDLFRNPERARKLGIAAERRARFDLHWDRHRSAIEHAVLGSAS